MSRPTIWRLMYAQAVTAYLYKLRQTGAELHAGIKGIATEPQPWIDDRAIQARPGRFERNLAGHWVGYEIERESKTIRVIYIQENK